MQICFGWSKRPLQLSPVRRYVPEELVSTHAHTNVSPLVDMPLWIQADGEHIRLNGGEQISLACQLVCVYHNGLDCRAPLDDGWNLETLKSEERAIQHMLTEASDDDTDTESE
jgi:hypothetical protein